MKNARHESKRRNAIRMLASGKITGHRPLINGVYVPHLYEEPYQKLAYWDDFGFRLNKQWVSVSWTHPRMNLLDRIEDIAHKEAEKISPFQSHDFFSDLTHNYTKVGNSRKKITSSTWNPSDTNKEYLKNYRDIRLKILKGEIAADVTVPTTRYTVEQMYYGKFVTITTPDELLNQDDIIQYAHKVKAFLKGELDLMNAQPSQYTLEDYHRDHDKLGIEIA